jgi:hypothetical protein
MVGLEAHVPAKVSPQREAPPRRRSSNNSSNGDDGGGGLAPRYRQHINHLRRTLFDFFTPDHRVLHLVPRPRPVKAGRKRKG